MKIRIALVVIFSLVSIASFSQVGVGVNHGRTSFFNINYQVSERFRPELRVTTNDFSNRFSGQLVLNYVVKKTEDMELYAGLGGGWSRPEGFSGVAPVGINLFPFKSKKIGFNMEVRGTFWKYGDEFSYILPKRSLLGFESSIGLRYRFGKK